ncbi:hypothetical protein FHY19_000373 [Xanthomonas arboricola]|nr:hypothetical protein [Xanthomonas sp. 4461]
MESRESGMGVERKALCEVPVTYLEWRRARMDDRVRGAVCAPAIPYSLFTIPRR